jgi:hypothetical protein
MMAKAKAPRKRRVGKRAPTRPVISVRLPEKVARGIEAEAKAKKVAVSEVVFNRLLGWEAWQATEAEPWKTEEVESVISSMQADDARDIDVVVRRGIKNIEAAVERSIANLEFAVGAAIERGIAKALKERKE